MKTISQRYATVWRVTSRTPSAPSLHGGAKVRRAYGHAYAVRAAMKPRRAARWRLRAHAVGRIGAVVSRGSVHQMNVQRRVWRRACARVCVRGEWRAWEQAREVRRVAMARGRRSGAHRSRRAALATCWADLGCAAGRASADRRTSSSPEWSRPPAAIGAAASAACDAASRRWTCAATRPAARPSRRRLVLPEEFTLVLPEELSVCAHHPHLRRSAPPKNTPPPVRHSRGPAANHRRIGYTAISLGGYTEIIALGGPPRSP
jgi:hypothetical protein